jgi:hypothetical protein
MIVARLFNIRVFSVVGEVCSLVTIRVGPLYIISFFFLLSIQVFIFWAHQWDLVIR